MNKEILINTTCILIGIMIGYFVVVFIEIEVDCALWSKWMRGLAVLFSTVGGFLGRAIGEVFNDN